MELAELVICPNVIRKQAAEHQLRQWEELSYVLIHGVLHLLGYEHETSLEDEEKMFQLQDKWFEAFCRKYERSKNKNQKTRSKNQKIKKNRINRKNADL